MQIHLNDQPPSVTYTHWQPNEVEMYHHHVVKNHVRPDVSYVSTAYPKDLVRIMKRCWDPLPDKRPSFEQLNHIMDDIRESIGDFDAKVDGSMKAMVEILDQLEDTRPHADFQYQQSIYRPTCSDPSLMSETTNLKRPISVHEERKQHARPEEIHDQHSTNSDSNGTELHGTSIVPQSEHGISDMDAPWCSTTKIVFGVTVAILFVAAVAIGVMIPVFNKSNNPPAKSGRCPSATKPGHGDVICNMETHDTAEKCRFLCDEGYAIYGTESISCIAGKWSSKQPTCERGCKLPTITNGELTCTNKTFKDSTCTVTCNKPYVIHGVSSITCQQDGSCSGRTPSCVCPNCTCGDNCEFSTSWDTVVNTLLSITAYSSVKVDYGGKMFTCRTELHSIKVLWTGICVDHDTGTQTKCSNNHASPRESAIAAAAVLISELGAKKDYPLPCDADKMPSPADC